MRTGSESDAREAMQQLLDHLVPGRFTCKERKTTGSSVINKPADLEIRFARPPQRVLVAVEVANVNTTQLVGEACRLYYDESPMKLLILGDRNVPRSGKDQCERLLRRLYGQDDIRNTPCRVVWYDDDKAIEDALRSLLLIECNMIRITVFYDREGNTVTVWFAEPAAEFVAEETGEEVILMKDKGGRVIGFEKLNFNPGGTDAVRVAFETMAA